MSELKTEMKEIKSEIWDVKSDLTDMKCAMHEIRSEMHKNLDEIKILLSNQNKQSVQRVKQFQCCLDSFQIWNP